jgi:uncharacterized protein
MFTLKLEDIPEEGLTLNWQESPDSIMAYVGQLSQIDFEFESPLQAEARVFKTGQSVVVQGTLRTVLRLQCARCLKEFSSPISSTLDLTLLPTEGDSAEEEEVELKQDDMESGFFEGGEIHLSELACEQVFLDLPAQPLCEEGCKGLCPVCGRDLNRDTCQCQREEPESAFAALKKLKLS